MKAKPTLLEDVKRACPERQWERQPGGKTVRSGHVLAKMDGESLVWRLMHIYKWNKCLKTVLKQEKVYLFIEENKALTASTGIVFTVGVQDSGEFYFQAYFRPDRDDERRFPFESWRVPSVASAEHPTMREAVIEAHAKAKARLDELLASWLKAQPRDAAGEGN
jgi:hypothetical protein